MFYGVGTSGGVRALIVLRSIVAEQGMPSIPAVYPIPKMQANLSEDGERLRDDLQRRFDDFIPKFACYMEAFAKQREYCTPY